MHIPVHESMHPCTIVTLFFKYVADSKTCVNYQPVLFKRGQLDDWITFLRGSKLDWLKEGSSKETNITPRPKDKRTMPMDERTRPYSI